jgi:hypothetical protein
MTDLHILVFVVVAAIALGSLFALCARLAR